MRGPEVDTQQLIEDLHTAYKSGLKRGIDPLSHANQELAFPQERSIQPSALRAEVSEAAQRLHTRINIFVDGIDPNMIKTHGPDTARSHVRALFDGWKASFFAAFLLSDVPEEEQNAVQNLTLREVAQYAGQEVAKSRKEVLHWPRGTTKQQEASEKLEYWQQREELLSLAASEPAK